jgi:phosphoribosyl 1,2-cyclic phosphate phosphodiesterase
LSAAVARARFLGTGTSHGVPMIGCRCATCRSDDPRDRRWRASLHIAFAGGLSVLIDTAPDLRSQVLTFGVETLDAVLFTHPHADHILGLDDVRAFNERHGRPISCYGAPDTIAEVRRVFAYAFRDDHVGGWLPQLCLFAVDGPFCLARQLVVPVPLWHGPRAILGYRVAGFAYLTDCSRIPDGSWPLLEGLDTLVVGALRDRPHPTHFTVAEALEAVARIRPRRALLTHVCHDLGHATTAARLPDGVELAYDGLEVDVNPSA